MKCWKPCGCELHKTAGNECSLQGVIHLANAALKLNMQRSVAADRLADKAIECFQEAFPAGGKETLMGLNAEELKGIASQCRPPGENISPLSIR